MYSTTPQLVSGGRKWLQVDTGESLYGQGCAVCGIASDYSGWCWGGNGNGQLGDGSSGNWRSVPTAIYAPQVTWSEIPVGYTSSCGITSASMITCWGSNEYGILGSEGPSTNIPRSIAVEGPWGQIEATASAAEGSSPPVGAIVGGVIGCLAVVAAIAAGFIIYKRRKGVANTNSSTSIKTDFATKKPATRPEDSIALSSLSTMNYSADPVLQWVASQPQQNSGASLRSSSSKSSIPDHLKSLEFAWQDARLLKPLGIGSFGKVFLAGLPHSPVAIKLLLDAKSVAEASRSAAASGFSSQNMLSSNAPSVASTDALIKEVSVMAPLRHPNVALLVGYCMNPPCVALEYASRGSLFDVLQAGNTDAAIKAELTWQRRLAMAADAAAGMLHLHTRDPSILHRDLKSPNLLVSGDWTVKVSDMGLSKLMDEATQGSQTTAGGAANPRWLAAEVLSGDRPTAAADVYSFGIVLWELLTWKLPWFDTPTVWNIVGNVQKGSRPTLPSKSELPGLNPSDSIDAYVTLMQRCWAQDPAARPDFNTIAAELRTMQGI